jgi:pyruvate dehydrogenase E2 component (dihydrolipoamide acetyltransferase)
VAVAIPEGLLTPVIRDADRKGVLTISREMRELAGRAREKRLKLEEMTDGTFSISNLGMYGIESFSAVINPPEGAILAVGTVRKEPVVKDDQIVPGQRMRMTLSADHRVIDGAVGAELMSVLRTVVENPASLAL